jgi:pSer/pThr/pTyr-binding forkhead associated (FHA) protein
MQGFGATPAGGFGLGPQNAVLRCTAGAQPGRAVPLASPRVTVGRSEPPLLTVELDLTPLETATPTVTSRRHAEIAWENGTLVVRDLGSTNGTFVNGVRLPGSARGAVSPPHLLHEGDRVRFANIEFEVAREGA